LSLRRDCDLRLERVSIGGHDIAVEIELESSIPGVSELARRLQDLKEAFALNDKVQRIVSLLKIALGKYDFVGCGASSQPQL
jgi:hypothetical protein